jgi:hypothetical protein
MSASALFAADTVQPTTATFSCLREEGISYINSTTYYLGTSINFTNCLLYATNTAANLQGLSGVTIQLKWGDPTTNQTFTPVVQNTNGVWCLSMTAPTNWLSPYIQIKITDGTANSYIYPWKMIRMQSAM